MELFDFRIRRSVHIGLHNETHKDLRHILLDKELSMQEVFQKFSELIVSDDKRAIKILDELSKEKREGRAKKAKPVQKKSNIDSIYDMIGENSFKEGEQDVNS